MESTANPSSRRYFCHICNTTITHTSTDYLCPLCDQGFIEKLSDGSSSASSSYTDRNSENGDEIENLPMVLDSLWNNMGNHVQVMIHHDEGASQNGNEGGTASSNQPGSNTTGRGAARRRARIDSYNLNPERLLTEFFNMSRNSNDNGQVFFVSNPGDYAWGREGLDTIVTQLLNQMDSSGPPPLASDKIQELPFVQITEQQVSENVQCSVCWDSFRTSDNVRQLPCEHIYHDPCIVPWLQLHGTCPICRKLLSEDNESRLGGFAQGGGLEALLSDVQRRLVTNRHPNTRCFRCSEFGHIARECTNPPVRWNRRNRGRGQRSCNNRRAGDWGSRSYETSWSNATWNDNWGDAVDSSNWGEAIDSGNWGDAIDSSNWGTASAPAQSSDWGPPSTSATDANGSSSAATGDNDTWGGNFTVSDREWPTSENTTSFEIHFDVPDDEPEWIGFEDFPSDSLSSDVEDLTLGGFGFDFDFQNSTSGVYPLRNCTRSNRNTYRCYNCDAIGHIARQCPLKSKPNDRGRKNLECDICSKSGHDSRHCWYGPNSTRGSRNSSSVHNPTSKYRGSSVKNRPPTPARLNVNNPSSRSSSNSRYRGRQRNDSYNQNLASSQASFTMPSTSRQTFHRSVTCWNCNEIGHIARDCRTRAVCYTCHRGGHTAKDCSQLPNDSEMRCCLCGGIQYGGCECWEVTDH